MLPTSVIYGLDIMAKGGGLRTQTSSLPGSHVIQLSSLVSILKQETCFSGRQYQSNLAPTMRNFLRQNFMASMEQSYMASSSMKMQVSCRGSISPRWISL